MNKQDQKELVRDVSRKILDTIDGQLREDIANMAEHMRTLCVIVEDEGSGVFDPKLKEIIDDADDIIERYRGKDNG